MCRFKSNTGHYSQVVWADTYAVGCAATKCSKGLSPIYACNYGTTGNFTGAPMYKKIFSYHGIIGINNVVNSRGKCNTIY